MITMCLDGGSLYLNTSWNDLCMQLQTVTNRTVWSNQVIYHCFKPKTSKPNETKQSKYIFFIQMCMRVCVLDLSIGIIVSIIEKNVHIRKTNSSDFVCIIFSHFALANLLELLFLYLIVLMLYSVC